MNITSLADCPRTELETVKRLITPAERAVWRAVADGLSLKEVAAQLGKSIKTVENQKTALHRKLGARGSADLTRLAVKYRVIAVEVCPE